MYEDLVTINIPRLLVWLFYPFLGMVCRLVFILLPDEDKFEYKGDWYGNKPTWEVGKDSENVWICFNIVTKQYALALGELSYISVYRIPARDVRLRKGTVTYHIWKWQHRVKRFYYRLIPFRGYFAYEVQVGPVIAHWVHSEGVELLKGRSRYPDKGLGRLRFSYDHLWRD